MATYTYSVSADVAGGTVNEEVLYQEIVEGLRDDCEEVEVSGDVITIEFSNGLSAGEVTTLEAILLAHGATPAIDVAESAQTSASAAQTSANAAQSTANSAISTANAAQSTANAASAAVAGKADVSYVDTFAKPRVFQTEDPVTSTFSTSFQTKMTTTPVTLEAGTYEVSFGYGWSHNDTSTNFEGKIQQDSGSGFSDFGNIHEEESQDSGGSFGSTGTDQRKYLSRTKKLVVASSGSYSWRIQYRTEDDEEQSSMWEAFIKVQRTA